jgi:hypothetical protein
VLAWLETFLQRLLGEEAFDGQVCLDAQALLVPGVPPLGRDVLEVHVDQGALGVEDLKLLAEDHPLAKRAWRALASVRRNPPLRPVRVNIRMIGSMGEFYTKQLRTQGEEREVIRNGLGGVGSWEMEDGRWEIGGYVNEARQCERAV